MADMIMIGDVGPGKSFKDGNDIYTSLNIEHNKTAMRGMIVKIKAKNLRTGSIREISYNGDTKVEQIYLDKRTMNLEYADDALVHFQDAETFEEVSIPRERLTWELNFISYENPITVTFFEKELLGVELPAKVTLLVTETDDNAVAGDTVNKATKDAVLETGYKLRVPMFIKSNTKIVVKTEDGQYDSRA